MLSIVIPALNEEKLLPRVLDSLANQAGAFEVLVVDGGSSDATVAIAGATRGVSLLHSAPGRAEQMNCGAAAARGDVLLFLHADTILPAGAVSELLALHAERRLGFGGFRQRFSGSAIGLRIVSAIHNWRCRLTGVFYGDQAMFVRRDLFFAVGGFPAVAELEDIMLSEQLLASGEQSCLMPAAVVTDSRKFEQMGVLRAFLYCLVILFCYELRLPLKGRGFFAAYR